MRFEDLPGRSVVIWGAGREGSAAYRELHRRRIPASIAVTDGAAVPEELESLVAVGVDAIARLASAAVIIKSPGIPRNSAEFRSIRDLGIAVTSLTDLWLSANHTRTIGVTGTKGKSTTSSLIHHLLVNTGVTSCLIGNGGIPVTEGDRDGARVAVAEISSYQAAELTTSPRAAVVTSLFPEHLPWHGGYAEYVHDKLNLIAHGPEAVVIPQAAGRVAESVRARLDVRTQVITPDSLGIRWSESGVHWEGVGSLNPAEISLRGQHNYANIALALAAVVVGPIQAGGSGQDLLAAVSTFAPLSHRIETVPSHDGRRWVDDGLATAPEAVVAALETFPTERVVLILGGADRGLSFDPLITYLATRSLSAAVDVVAVGPAGERWAASGGPTQKLAQDFTQALAFVRSDPQSSDVVLLSPGAPSFDEFLSYEERAAAFREAASRGPA